MWRAQTKNFYREFARQETHKDKVWRVIRIENYTLSIKIVDLMANKDICLYKHTLYLKLNHVQQIEQKGIRTQPGET